VHATFDPYDHLERLPDVRVVATPLPDGEMGCYVHDSRTVHVDPRLTAVEERCTVAHEGVHAERGDTCLLADAASPDAGRLELRQERDVHRIAASRLLVLEALADVLARTHGLAEAAEEAGVDEDTLWHRLQALTPHESAHLAERIERLEEASWPI
jgi:hypothetical protein